MLIVPSTSVWSVICFDGKCCLRGEEGNNNIIQYNCGTKAPRVTTAESTGPRA